MESEVYMICPECKEEVEDHVEIETEDLWTAYNARDGLMAWGPWSAEKALLHVSRVAHIRFGDKTSRLVTMLPPHKSHRMD